MALVEHSPPIIFLDPGIFSTLKELPESEKQKVYDETLALLPKNSFSELETMLLAIKDPVERGEQIGCLSYFGDGLGIRNNMDIDKVAMQSLKDFADKNANIFIKSVLSNNPIAQYDQQLNRFRFPTRPVIIPFAEEEAYVPLDKADDEIIISEPTVGDKEVELFIRSSL